MERERSLPRTNPSNPDAGPDAPDGTLERVRSDGSAMLDEADRILDGLQPVEVEEYLAQSRQRGGE